MPNFLTRVVCLFVVPCLLADPGLAAALSQPVRQFNPSSSRKDAIGLYEHQALIEGLTDWPASFDKRARLRTIEDHPTFKRLALTLPENSASNLLPVQPEEIAVGRESLRRYFAVSPQVLAKRISERLPGLSMSSIEIVQDGIRFFLRKAGVRNIVWAFRQSDIDLVARWMNVPRRSDIAPIAENEVEVAREGLQTAFVGDTWLFSNELRDRLEAAADGKNEAVIDGITFIKRKSLRREVWTFHADQVPEVGRLMKWTLRTGHPDIPVGGQEVVVSNNGLKAHYVGDAKFMTQQLQRQIEESQVANHPVVVHGIPFLRRVLRGHSVWVFAQADASALAGPMGWRMRSEDMRPLEAGEIAVTVSMFHRLLQGNAQVMANKLNSRLYALSQGRKKIVLEGIQFTQRTTDSGNIVWAMAGQDVANLTRVMNWRLRGEPRPAGQDDGALPTLDGDPQAEIQKLDAEETALLRGSLAALYVGDADAGRRALQSRLTSLAGGLNEVTVDGISFFRRRSGGHVAWVFQNADVEAVGRLMGLASRASQRLEEIRPQEIAVSTKELPKHFIGNGNNLAAKLMLVLPTADRASPVEFVVQDIRFRQRLKGTSRMWAFHEDETSAVAAKFDLILRSAAAPELQAVEIAVTGPGLLNFFEGNRAAIMPKFAALPSVTQHHEPDVDLRGVNFFKRRVNGATIWAFKETSLDAVAVSFGLRRRNPEVIPQIGQDEIAVSQRGLRVAFFGNGWESANAFLADLPSPERSKDLELVRRGVRFVRRRAGFRTVWAFEESDTQLVAAAFGLLQRRDSAALIESLGLDDAIALLGDDPLRLKQYIQLFHPELAAEDVDSIAAAGSMRGLRADPQDNEDELHDGFEVSLPAPFVHAADLPDLSTQAHAYKLEGRTEPGIRYVQVTGAYTRRILVRQDGSFSATLPIPRTGEPNQYFFYPFKTDTEQRGEAAELTIHQTGVKEDTEAAFLRLMSLKEDVLESIKINPARYHFLLHSLEQSLLRHFTYGEDQGFSYLSERIQQERSQTLKEMLRVVEAEFGEIARMRFAIKSDQHLYFFQKYTVFKVDQLLHEPDPVTGKIAQGVIIANEPGLGKTVTALVILNGKESVIITPNGVVSTWLEQGEKFMPQARMKILEGNFIDRQKALDAVDRPQVITNVEFMQGMTGKRAAALSARAEMLVVDEADYLGRLSSQQSKGTRMIQSTFRLLLTATPFKRISHIGNLMGFLYPDDPSFRSAKAFSRAFPSDNPESLNALFLLMQRHTIRVRKKDVFEEYDAAVPLTRQSDRLPKKVEVDPAQMGRFSLLKEQCDSIRQLFTDYQAWCQAHRVWVEQAGATTEDKKYKRFKEGFFPKLQALRQIMNDPAYFGQPELESPKHLEMDRIVHHELDGDQNADHKVIIFCKYVAEVEAYLKRFESYGAIGYYGELPRDSNGYKIDAEKNREYYEVDPYENFVLKDGRPTKTTKGNGRPIRALDYQRLLFQNDPRSRVLVATYDTGSVGVTLTGAHAVINDDLAPTYRDQYQADDRAHRIDNERKKYEVRYYRLQATYPESWLKSLDPELMHDYFEMGTYDQVQYDNLRIQGRIFHRIMDGVGDESELAGIRHRFLANRMPFLFKGADAQDTEEATAPELIEGHDAVVEAEAAGEVDDEGGSQGLLSIWKPLIPWLQERGWSDTRIAGVLGGSEEFLFSGVLVGLGSLLLTHVFGISLTHALEITSFISGILFPLSHWKERFRLVGGQLTLAPPNEKKKDLVTLSILSAVLRLTYVLPLAHLPFEHWNTLAALPIAIFLHAIYNAYLAPALKWSLGMLTPVSKPDPAEAVISSRGLSKFYSQEVAAKLLVLMLELLGKPPATPVTRTIERNGFTLAIFNRRLPSNGVFVWACKEPDKIGKLFSDTLPPEFIKKAEIPVTGEGFEPFLFQKQAQQSAAQLNSQLGPIPNRSEMKTLKIGERDFLFISRSVGGARRVWALAKKDMEPVLQSMNLPGRILPLSDDDMVISFRNLCAYFSQSRASRLSRFIELHLGPVSSVGTVRAIKVGESEIQFYTRQRRSYTFWCCARTDLPFLRRLDEMMDKSQARVDAQDVVVSNAGLSMFFTQVQAEFIVKALKRELGPAARSGEKKTIALAGKETAFIAKRYGAKLSWITDAASIVAIAAHFNMYPKDPDLLPMKPDEVGISSTQMQQHFRGDRMALTRRVLQAIESQTGQGPRVINEITFTMRTSGGHPQWAFHSSDLARFALVFDAERRQDASAIIEELKLEEAISLLGDDPLRLKQYIQLYHPELAPEEVDAIAVTGAMRGLRGDVEDKDELHKGYDVTLPAPAVIADLPEHSTAAHAFKISGKTEPGVRYVQVIGAYTRRIVVRHDGTFSATLPIPRTGEPNQYFFYPVIDDATERGEATELIIHQTGTKEDTEAAFLRLLALKEEVLESIKINPARYHFLLHSLEQSLLRHFTYGEDQGFAYLKGRIRQEKSKVLHEMLQAVETEFRQIAGMHLNIRPNQRLYFFQKYTAYKVNHLLTVPDPVTGQVAQGVIIANEQGLGKTVTALVIVNGKEAVIITPNSVVSTWAEQEEKFMPQARMEILEGTYAEREAALMALTRPQVAINVEFTQGMTEERAAALSNKAEILVVDEADYLGRLASQQSKGTRMIKSVFRLLLTATPFKKVSHIGNLLGFLYPNDSRFNSSKAFARAFPADNPESLNALFLLMQRHTIRVRKKDVFEEYDPAKPLSQQSDRLPRKVEVDPAQMGRFSLLKEQCDSIRQLFTDYQAWCQAHRVWVEQAGATTEDKKYKRFKEGFFPKLQALRQIMNDPAYFGQPELESPKHLEMDRIVHHELDGDQNTDHKVIIFCKYVAEVEAYLKRFESYGAIGYYGELPRDSNGYKIDAGKDREYYKVDEYENFVLKNGRPVLADKTSGRPIRALDYQRLLFQNDPRSRILVSTYETGSVGVTLTGAHAVIDDDLAPTYRDQYQADDRAHRIDNERKKYEVRYYRLQATYPESWLKSLDPELMHDYFEMGTYDQVQYENLRIQSRIFHRIMDGVGDESELVGIRRRFLANRMPFLFKGTDALDTEEATAAEIIEGKDAGVEAESAGEVEDEGGSQGLLSIWKPLIPWLQERGWSDTRIAGVLGGSEEFLFSGVLVSLGSLLLIHVFGISLTHALEITSFISGILFPLAHWKERYRLVGGQLTLAPPNEKKKDLITLAILGTALRLLYAVPLADLPFGHWNSLIALPLTFLGHAAYNAWIAPRLNWSIGMSAAGLMQLPDDEIAVSTYGLKRHFIGDPAHLMHKLNDLIEQTAGSGRPLQVDLSGVRFKRRLNGVHRVWAFEQAAAKQVAQILQASMRDEKATDSPKAGEIVVSTLHLRPLYIGNSGTLARKLNALIEAHATAGEHLVTVEGILFSRRLIANHSLWAFNESDKIGVGKLLQTVLREQRLLKAVGSHEIVISADGLKAHFIGKNSELAKTAQHLIAQGLPLGPDVVRVGDVQFSHRVNGVGQEVWVFDAADKKAVAALLDTKLREVSSLALVQAGEIAVTGTLFQPHFVGTAPKLAERINRALEQTGDPQDTHKTVFHVVFTKRLMRNGVEVWAFSEIDLEIIASALRVPLRKEFKLETITSEEIPISSRGVGAYFTGDRLKLSRQLAARIDHAAATGSITTTLDGVEFTKRISGFKPVWAFRYHERQKVAGLLGTTLREDQDFKEIDASQVRVSYSGMRAHFVGDSLDLTKRLNTVIEQAASGSPMVVIAGVHFTKGVAANHVMWSFPEKDKRTVATLLGVRLHDDSILSEVGLEEIVVSNSGLAPYVAGYSLAKQLNRSLDTSNPDGATEMDWNGIHFTRRLNSHNVIWAFHHSDLPGLATTLDWTLRRSADELSEEYGLVEAIALLGNDPLRLKQYIQLYHPELSPDDVDAITVAGSMRGLRGDALGPEEIHKNYEMTLPVPSVTADLPELSTAGHAFKLEGKTEPGIRYIQVIGAYTRKIVVRQDGTFSATLPIPRAGELNRYFFYPVKDETRERGEAAEILIRQTGTKEDTEAAFLRLLALKEEVLESIKVNPGRHHFLLNTLEQSLLRHFTYGEDQGFAYLAERIRQEQSKALREMLRAVETEFRQIAGLRLNIRANQRLYFFQKYTVYKAKYLLTEPDPVTGQVARGVIIANEQGLGKTVTALVIINGSEAVIITPNSVVSTWAEQEEKFMPQARMEILEGTYAERQAALSTLTRPQVATNVEFTQGMTEERATALSNKAEILVVDEADYLGRLSSQQSKGTRMIQAATRLLLTATPFKKVSHIGNLLGFLYPDNRTFGSTRAFARAFPADNPESLNALFLLMQRHTIRVRKKDVFEEYDAAVPLTRQSDRLPKKVEVDPAQMGRFSLLKEQCDSIRQLFTYYQAWCQAHRVWVEQAGATPEDKKYKRFNEGFFPKLQALRQIMNDPAYFGQPELESPKHLEMDRIVHHELDGDQNADHKVIIFCKYVAEVEAYLKRYESYGAIGYYGELPRDSNGYKVNDAGEREYYQIDEYENFLLKDGKPVRADKTSGRPIRALDYQRLLFQNDPKSRIMVSTYETGSVGVTLTGAHAVIDDDLAPTYRDQYQSDDRAHRIDNDRKKYEVRYYRLQATYPEGWLKSLDPALMHDYFEMGTYDQVQYENLRIQARIFHRIMDGVGHESELVGIRRRFLANRMPFLFKGVDAQDTEEATAPELLEGKDAGVEAEAAGEIDDEDASQGLLSIWKPVIPLLQAQGWSDIRIAGVLGGAEELFFSAILVSLGALLLTHMFNISLTHALNITSIFSGILFPITHWRERYRLVGGQLNLAPPNQKKKDLAALSILGAVLRLLYALPLNNLPFGHLNILIALPLVSFGHAAYNAWIAPRLRASLAIMSSAQLSKAA